jgi:hypothetical protein
MEFDGGGVNGVAARAWPVPAARRSRGVCASREEQRPPFKATRALACDRRVDGDMPRGGCRPR